MHAEVRMKPEENSSKGKTEPSGKGKLGRRLGGIEETGKKSQKGEKNQPTNHKPPKHPELGSQ